MYVCMYVCVTQGCFLDNKFSVRALGTDSSMTKPTFNSTLYTFIEQVNFYDLQKMVLQFAICFVPLWVIPIWFTACIIKTKAFNTIIQYAFYHKSIKSNKIH